ncbi:hypothetical protein Cgig2_031558 [Carnegiea gigantea]|uniref:Uncharacterized protein n=1 Tax=Carnegiea gigantea TaxID=171969 RepID=A0A9Q1JMW7_9CARY|nr:hypothetical protein Cgig2_031558 [Carnegiea gigantea]
MPGLDSTQSVKSLSWANLKAHRAFKVYARARAPPKGNGGKPYNEEGEDDGKGEPDNRKKEEGEETGTPQTNPCIDDVEQLFKESAIKLARETPTEATNTWKGDYQNRNKKDNDSTNIEMHALDCYTEYTTIGSIYSQALQLLLSKDRINLLPSKVEIENRWKPKN